jgi:hypothetical protein
MIRLARAILRLLRDQFAETLPPAVVVRCRGCRSPVECLCGEPIVVPVKWEPELGGEG